MSDRRIREATDLREIAAFREWEIDHAWSAALVEDLARTLKHEAKTMSREELRERYGLTELAERESTPPPAPPKPTNENL